MAISTKIIKRRLKSVNNIKKITRAMEMVSAVKMRRAVEAAVRTRTYAKLAWDLLVHLSRTQKDSIPLLEARQVKKLLLILITSNRGLCGSFNSNIIRKTAVQLKDPKNISQQRIGGKEVAPSDKIEIDIIGIGKKGAVFAKKMNYNLIASFTDLSDTPTLIDSLPISRMGIDAYEQKKYDKVVVAYSDFKSALLQVAKLRQVLPVSEQDLEKMIGDAGEKSEVQLDDFLFEPNTTEVLKIILPRLVETQVYQSLLESSASEHSARMMAMRNATESATEMIDELTLNYNKARQAGITKELAEIAGGAAALE